MLHTNEKVIKHKVGLLNLAEELGNVSKACQVMELSRDTFYRYKSAVDEGGLILTESQVQALEKKKLDDVAHGEIETTHPSYLGAQDVFYVGTLKGVGRVYQQTYIDTYSKVAQAKLYTTKTPITAADILNDQVLPFYVLQELPILRILTYRGTEYCGNRERHDYQRYL